MAQLPKYWLATVPASLLLACVLVSVLSWSETPAQRRQQAIASWRGRPLVGRAQRRQQAIERWQARPFTSYRITIRVEYGGNACTQELETEGEQLNRVVANSCRVSWIGMTTVMRLFEVSALLDKPTPCYTQVQACSCLRVLQQPISYDANQGYPSTIIYQRAVQPNYNDAAYWRRLWQTRRVPNCGPTNYAVAISVLSIQPLA